MASQRQILKAIRDLRPAVQRSLSKHTGPGPSCALSYLERWEQILKSNLKSATKRRRLNNEIGGLGKTVLDDYPWSVSRAGDRFWTVANTIEDYCDT